MSAGRRPDTWGGFGVRMSRPLLLDAHGPPMPLWPHLTRKHLSSSLPSMGDLASSSGTPQQPDHFQGPESGRNPSPRLPSGPYCCPEPTWRLRIRTLLPRAETCHLPRCAIKEAYNRRRPREALRMRWPWLRLGSGLCKWPSQNQRERAKPGGTAQGLQAGMGPQLGRRLAPW